MNITDFRHLPFNHIPDAVIDACARAALDREIAKSGLAPCTDEEWARPSGFRAWAYLVKGYHREARRKWAEEQSAGQVIIDALAAADVINGEWSADAPGRIEAALREAGWKLTPL